MHHDRSPLLPHLPRATAVAALLTAAVLAVPSAARAQGLTYTQVTQTEFGGPMGKILSKLGGGMKSEETVYLDNGKMRTDREKSSTILDTQGGRFIFLDHQQKQYYAMSLDDMMNRVKQMGQQLNEAQAQQQAQPQASPGDSSNMQVSFDLNVDRTGKTEQIAGYSASEVIVTLKTTATGTDEQTGETSAMNMVVLNDMWLSKDAQLNAAIKELGAGMGEMAQQSGASMTEGLQAAFGRDPRIKEGLEKAKEESSKLEGMQLRGTTYIVMVPPGVEFDRELALEGPEKKEDEGGAGADAAKKALSRSLAGLLGRKPKDEPKEEEKETSAPQQITFMTMTTEVTNLKSGPVPADRFEIPAGYKEVQSPLGAQGGAN